MRRNPTALVLVLAFAAMATPARGAPPAAQDLTEVLRGHAVYAAPSRTSTARGRIAPRRPFTGARTTLPTLSRRTGADGHDWLRVRLPGRPNGHSGWIRRAGTLASTTSWRIVVATARRRVIVYHRGRRARTIQAIVGSASTPTPTGEFFVEEAIQLAPSAVGAPYALTLSARSTVLQEFAGGPGQIALHGLGNVGGVLGTAVSHGCVRLDDVTMRWLVPRIGPGVPVTITR